MSAEDVKNICWPWLSPLRRWGILTMKSTVKFICMTHHFTLLRLNPFELRVHREAWWFENSMPYLRVVFSAEGAKNVSWPWLSRLRLWGSLTMTSTGNFYIWLTISSCYGSIPLVFGLIVRDGALSTLCHSCGFACQQTVLNTFRGPDCLNSEHGVV